MRNTIIAIGAILALSPMAASAQSAAENFSYSAPSGMFGEGTAKWQLYRFMHEDRERTERLRAGNDIPTGSIQGTAVGDDRVRRPGERGSRRETAR